MKQVLYLLAFKMLCLLYQFWTAAEVPHYRYRGL